MSADDLPPEHPDEIARQLQHTHDYIRARYGSPLTTEGAAMTPLSDSEAATVQRFEDAEPAPESWGGGLREALAEAIWVNMPDEPYRQDADIAADAVLALPELAALRAKADAADRVRELVEHDLPGDVLKGLIAPGVIRRIRAALDGPPC